MIVPPLDLVLTHNIAMKIGRLLLIACLPITSVFGEMRTFTSKDGQKTFRGDIIDYDASTKKVKMRMARGKVMEFPITVLSKDHWLGYW